MDSKILRVFLGVIVLAVGVLALLNATHVVSVDLSDIIGTWWPLLLVALGLLILASNPRGWLPALLFIAIGVIFQLNELDLWDVSVWSLFWPAVLIIIGIWLLVRTLRPRTVQGSTVNAFAFWWGSDRKVLSQDFKGGSATAVMGGVELDLRGASIPPGSRATVSVTAVMGGVEIRVPLHWRVEASGLPLLGGWSNRAKPPLDPGAPVLEVRLTTILGGAEIKN